MSDEGVGTPEELLRLLEDAGLGRRQRETWVTRPSAYLSGLVPGEAITDPATAGRARRAVARLIDRLPQPIPAGVQVVAARLVEAEGWVLEIDFAWDHHTGRRCLDARPYLWGRGLDRLRNDHAAFAQFYVQDGNLQWAGNRHLAADLLFGESWPTGADDGGDS